MIQPGRTPTLFTRPSGTFESAPARLSSTSGSPGGNPQYFDFFFALNVIGVTLDNWLNSRFVTRLGYRSMRGLGAVSLFACSRYLPARSANPTRVRGRALIRLSRLAPLLPFGNWLPALVKTRIRDKLPHAGARDEQHSQKVHRKRPGFLLSPDHIFPDWRTWPRKLSNKGDVTGKKVKMRSKKHSNGETTNKKGDYCKGDGPGTTTQGCGLAGTIQLK